MNILAKELLQLLAEKKKREGKMYAREDDAGITGNNTMREAREDDEMREEAGYGMELEDWFQFKEERERVVFLANNFHRRLLPRDGSETEADTKEAYPNVYFRDASHFMQAAKVSGRASGTTSTTGIAEHRARDWVPFLSVSCFPTATTRGPYRDAHRAPE